MRAAEESEGIAGHATEDLAKVRDLLFGSDLRENDKRFQRIEERLVKEASDLREDFRRRIEAVEKRLRADIESLGGQIKAERSARSGTIKELSKEVGELTRSMEKRLHDLDQRSAGEQQKLRERILEQSKRLLEELRLSQDEQNVARERALEELRADKADRSALADLFTELAVRLKKEIKIPRKASG